MKIAKFSELFQKNNKFVIKKLKKVNKLMITNCLK